MVLDHERDCTVEMMPAGELHGLGQRRPKDAVCVAQWVQPNGMHDFEHEIEASAVRPCHTHLVACAITGHHWHLATLLAVRVYLV